MSLCDSCSDDVYLTKHTCCIIRPQNGVKRYPWLCNDCSSRHRHGSFCSVNSCWTIAVMHFAQIIVVVEEGIVENVTVRHQK